MLTRPEYGWTDFSLEGTSTYSLSYLNDLPFDWLEAAIHGLKTLSPFCVEGFMEPRRMLCLVSCWNCHIIEEDDERKILREDDIKHEYSHTSMLEFCKFLYEDISCYADEWAVFIGGFDEEYEEDRRIMKEKKEEIRRRLEELKTLISEREVHFGKNRCFF